MAALDSSDRDRRDSVPRVKGTGFLNLKSHVEQQLPPGTWDRVLAALPSDDRLQVRSALGIGWYDLELWARLLRIVDQVGGRGDLSLLPSLACADAEGDFAGVLRILLRIANPAFAVEQAARLWPRFHDSGKLNVERIDGTHCQIHIDAWGVVDEALCRHMGAYMARVLELVGATEVSHSHVACRAAGASRCTFEYAWK
jgi:hypothetical protein